MVTSETTVLKEVPANHWKWCLIVYETCELSIYHFTQPIVLACVPRRRCQVIIWFITSHAACGQPNYGFIAIKIRNLLN